MNNIKHQRKVVKLVRHLNFHFSSEIPQITREVIQHEVVVRKEFYKIIFQHKEHWFSKPSLNNPLRASIIAGELVDSCVKDGYIEPHGVDEIVITSKGCEFIKWHNHWFWKFLKNKVLPVILGAVGTIVIDLIFKYAFHISLLP